jgi:DnaJ-class molecular chaperone
MNPDPYDVLGVARGASDDMIKTAYRKKAKKHHPDKGGNEEDFLKIQDAYQILSTPELREAFDRSGWQGVEMARGNGGASMSDMPEFFSQFFGGMPMGAAGHPRGGFTFFQSGVGGGMGGGVGGMGGNGVPGKQKKMPDRVIPLTVDLHEAYQGKTIQYRLKRKKYRGSSDNYKPCDTCKGMGKVSSRPPNIPSFLMVPATITVCPNCAGLGIRLSEKDMEVVSDTLTIQIPRFCPDEFPVVIHGKTDEIPGMEPGDAVFVIKYKEDCKFRVEGHHILSTLSISLQEAIGGFSRTIEFLDGKCYSFVLPQNTSLFTVTEPGIMMHDAVRVVENKGFYLDRNMLHRGNWVVQLNIKFPTGNTSDFWKWRATPINENNDTQTIILSGLPTLRQVQEQEDEQHHRGGARQHQQECRQS